MRDPRHTLEQLIRDRGEDYAAMSRLLNRNKSYIQQYIRRGTPRKLDETDRKILAEYFGIPDQWLCEGWTGGEKEISYPTPNSRPENAPHARSEMVVIPRYDVRASAGHGAIQVGEQVSGHIGFHSAWLKQLSKSAANQIAMIKVTGDSMYPTLIDGDDIMVDRGDSAERLRDGIYVLRVDDVLMVKRLARNPASGGFDIRSDNPAYPVWSNCNPEDMHILGRVIWTGRKIG